MQTAANSLFTNPHIGTQTHNHVMPNMEQNTGIGALFEM